MSKSEGPVVVNAATLSELVRTSNVPVLVDFYADWCAPCKYMAPVLERFARKHVGEVVVAKLNTDHNPVAADEHGISSPPCAAARRRRVARGKRAAARSVARARRQRDAEPAGPGPHAVVVAVAREFARPRPRHGR